jgi:hypothetical protein
VFNEEKDVAETAGMAESNELVLQAQGLCVRHSSEKQVLKHQQLL